MLGSECRTTSRLLFQEIGVLSYKWNLFKSLFDLCLSHTAIEQFAQQALPIMKKRDADC